MFRFSPYYLSQMVWPQAIDSFEAELEAIKSELRVVSSACEEKRSAMAYNTGSISFSSMLCLYSIVRFAGVKSAFEIGTFIGKSALSIAAAMDVNGSGQIHTCDGSNDFDIPVERTNTTIKGYGKTKSTEALKSVSEQGLKFDFVHIDGRPSQADIDTLTTLLEPGAIIALDDFEGMEKGVIALTQLRQSEFFNRHVLVYPPALGLLNEIGCRGRSTTALLIPADLFHFTNQ